MWWNRKDGDTTANNNNTTSSSSSSPRHSRNFVNQDHHQEQPPDQGEGSHSSSSNYLHNNNDAHRTSSVPSKKSRAGGTNRQAFLSSKSMTHRRNRRKGKEVDEQQEEEEEEDTETAVAETYSGFEVSLASRSPQQQQQQQQSQPQQRAHESRSSNYNTNTATTMGLQIKPIISFQEELMARQKINRTQYSVTQFPALGPKARHNNNNTMNSSSPAALSSGKNPVLLNASHQHRVQLQGDANNQCNATSFEDCLFLLRSHEVVDEMTSLKEEIDHMTTEINALHTDRTKLEEITAAMVPNLETSSRPQSPQPQSIPASVAASSEMDHSNNVPTAWDVNELLASKTITNAQRCQLQAQRGIQLTISFHDRQATEALATRCGVKHHVLAKLKEKTPKVASSPSSSNNNNNNVSNHNPLLPHTVSAGPILELTADTCREGGAATHVQHISLLAKDGGGELSFFLGRDQGKSVYWGHLPDRLYRRMQDRGMNPKQSASELTYLVTGPMDYYYAEFRSGEAWWGSSVEDGAFHSICTEWDVYRVVFGPKLVFANTNLDDGADPHTHQTSSWVILSRDGRAAWKNLPSRLDHLLQSRMADQAGLAEVSLGCGDAYFCRFLDGTVDYCLPSPMATVCQELEMQGSTITSIALHPELSHDFVIRSSNGYA